MTELPSLIRDLCQLRRGPQDLPYSKPLLIALAAASVLLDLGMASALDIKGEVLSRSLLSLALLFGLAWTALALRGLGNRLVQTLSALIACAMVFSLLMLPIAFLSGPPPTSASGLTPLQVLLAWAALAVMLWKLTVDAHILRHALEMRLPLAFALALAWAIADYTLGRAAFGPAS